MKDSEKQQMIDACGGMRSAANILGLLSSLSQKARRQFPDDDENSPRLRITISMARLGIQAGVTRRQVIRAIELLIKREFITAWKSVGEVTGYYVRPGAIERWVQPMELFKQPSNVTGTSDIKSQVGVTSCHRYLGHHVTGPSISSYNSSSSSPGADDETLTEPEKETPAAPHHPVGLHAQPACQDGEREGLIQACREVGIVRKKAETLLIDHSRQKIQAAFAHLRVRLARGDTISRPFGRFIMSFLRDPGAWEHELDLTNGCWTPVITLVRRAREQAKPRDRPPAPHPSPLTPLPQWAAWDDTSQAQREEIKQQVDRQYPELHPRAREALYAQEALRRQTDESKARTNPEPMQRGDGPSLETPARTG